MKKTLLSLLVALFMTTSATALAQTSTEIDMYGMQPATLAINGLGTNITDTVEQEFIEAKAMGVTHVRFDCSWTNTENLAGPNSYTLDPTCQTGLNLSYKYGMHPMINALYGPPFWPQLTTTTVGDIPVGSRTMTLSTVLGVVPGQSYVAWLGHGDGNAGTNSCFTRQSSNASYGCSGAGSLIATVGSGNVLNLAGVVHKDVPAGTTVTINVAMYPPVILSPGQSITANPSLIAYGGFAHFLATQIVSYGLTGQVSLWNEPIWDGECWDDARNCYSTPPANSNVTGMLALYMATTVPVPGVTYNDSYTEKPGQNGSILVPGYSFSNNYRFLQNVGSQDYHPYGVNPEDPGFIQSCMSSAVTSNNLNSIYQTCVGAANQGGNAVKGAIFYSLVAGNLGIANSVTEDGIQRSAYPSTMTELKFANFNLRRYLLYSELNITPVFFYRLENDSDFQWFNSSHQPYQVATTFTGLMNDLKSISYPMVGTYPAYCYAPVISSYSGSYPLAEGGFVGSATATSTANSIYFNIYQQSYDATRNSWPGIASPANASVSIIIPTGYTVTSALDELTQTAVTTTVSSGKVSVPVSDHPIRIRFDPNAGFTKSSCS